MKTEILATVALASFTVAAAAVSSPVAMVGLFGLSIIGVRNVDCFSSNMQTFTVHHCKEVHEHTIWGSGLRIRDSAGNVVAEQWDRKWNSCQEIKFSARSGGKYSLETLTGYLLMPWLSGSKKATVTAGAPAFVNMDVVHRGSGAKATFS